MALLLGGGLKIDLKRFSILLEGKYLYGLTNIDNNPEIKIKTQTRELRVSLAIIK